MYETIDGRMIDGEITIRNERTMIVLGSDGYNHLCKLVGEGVKRERKFIINEKNPGRSERNISGSAIRVIYPNGEYEDFRSMQIAGETFKISRHAVSRFCSSERKVAKGRFKGYEFIRL